MWRKRFAVAGVIVVAAAVAIPIWRLRPPQWTLVAHFSRAVGIHEGSTVRVLGVAIGEVVAVRPEGRTVRVDLRYERSQRLPADVQAIIVPPSVVSDRYIQLAPAYVNGATLADGADLPTTRTAVPLEIDDIFRSLDEFNKALGPDGANADGALSDLLATGRANLAGNGAQLKTTLDGLSGALSTVADGRQDLFATVANLQQLSTALARSDQQVRAFNQQLADVAEQLAAERADLAAALHSLSLALGDVATFIRDNRAALSDNVAALADITTVLAREQKAIIEILDIAPLALSNLNLAYNARSGTLDTRDNALGPYDPASYVCTVIADAVAPDRVPRECIALAQTLNAKGLPLTDQLRRLLGLAGTGASTAPGRAAPGGPAPAQPANPVGPALPQLPAEVTGPIDRTLNGILGGTP
jgi:phospholipid/cholesterol/gamma-HCH transport system substrate-binding protein